MRTLIQLACEGKKHGMVAGIESENRASFALHKKLCFTAAGIIKEVGNKFGRWLDLTLMQLCLDDRSHP